MKKIGIVDIVVTIAVILAMIVGFFTYMHFRSTADKQIEKNSKIVFQVFVRGVTITSGANPIRPGDETFLTIRNVPYTKLEVINSQIFTKKVVMPNVGKTPAFVMVDDYSQLFMYDLIVTIIDKAKITKDGAVIGGNKIKIGMPITIEGIDYKFNGTVSSVQVLADSPQAQQNQNAANPTIQKPNEEAVQNVQSQQSPQAQQKSEAFANPIKLHSGKAKKVRNGK